MPRPFPLARSSMTLPNCPTPLGMQFHQQALVTAPGQNQLGGVVSNAATASIGN